MNTQTKNNNAANTWLSNVYKYGKSVNSHDALKIAAITLMFIDHIGYYLFDNNSVMRLIGRSAAPLFYFLIGYTGKVNCKPSLLIYGGILSLTGLLFGHTFWINILYTFIFAYLILLYIPTTKLPVFVSIGLMVALIAANSVLYPYVEYGTLGIIIAITAHWLKEKVPLAGLWLALALGLHMFWQALVFNLFRTTVFTYGTLFITLSLWLVLYNYKLISLKIPKLCIFPSLLISRYSLDIYFYHVFLLKAYHLAHKYGYWFF
ncbi:conjugal transfer protein TraX [Candidatus Berkiella cookevillensis]|uniref:Conjugal transfer protein TraX n=1 Tax=Candidatus Berkiella cookevillensis TaxID=437022 RepID=A0A0Q9Y9E1_9GAMM|nr:TraX family protein [Candidatus Berkiella cookevillensis]MCS5707771.1 conjugal transfer protein TraX [Candidatus Berkiella cookevillensis]